MNIYIFGYTGRLGRELEKRLGREHFVWPFGRSQVDVTNLRDVVTEIEASKPDVVINATAMNGLEACKNDPLEAIEVNTTAPAAMAAACKNAGALLIHFSSDYVFSGDILGLYEDTPTRPWGIYGKTKLWGEEAIRMCAGSFFVFRLSSLYGHDMAGVLEPLKQAQRGAGTPGNPVKVLHQYCAPTSTRLVAEAVVHVLGEFDKEWWQKHSDVYHLASQAHSNGESGVSKLNFTRYLLHHVYGDPSWGPWSVAEGTLPEPRPIHTVLKSVKFEETFKYKMPTWREDLNSFLPQLGKLELPTTVP